VHGKVQTYNMKMSDLLTDITHVRVSYVPSIASTRS